LRVEQELAADAWGATLAGGSTAYLTTLAGMAIRQDDRTTIWAARPFLPASGTLLRRIEMLRDHKQPKTFAFSRSKQIVLWTAAIAIALLIAGLRGPDGSSQSLAAAQADASNSAKPAAQPQHTAVGSVNGVITLQGAENGPIMGTVAFSDSNGTVTQSTGTLTLSGGTITIAAGSSPLSLDYVPENAELVAAARVNELAASPALRMFQSGIHQQVSDFEKKAGFSLGDIEQLTFVGGNLPDGSWRRTILRANKPYDWTKVAAAFVNNPIAVDSPLTALAGKNYYKSGRTVEFTPLPIAGDPICYIIPDDRTIIFGPESEMNWVLAELVKPPAKPRWADLWGQASSGSTTVMVDIGRVRKALEPKLHEGNGELLPYVSIAGPVWNYSDRLVIGTDLGDKKLGLLVLDQCVSDLAAEPVEQTTTALLTLAGNGLAAAEKIDSQGMSDEGGIKKVLIDAAKELVKQAKVSRKGNTVEIRSEANGATLLALSSIMLPAMAKSRQAAQRSQSMNNLKQLALAMTMYEVAHAHYPPAVVIGPDGKTPHSWRVELLPYLDQGELYHQYKTNEPWDSPANKKVLEAAPKVFHAANDSSRGTNSSYFVFTGKNTMFSNTKGIRAPDVTGGLSETIMIVAAKRDIPWTKPEDIEFDPAKPLPELGLDGRFIAAAFGDGSVRLLEKDMNEQILKSYFSISDNDKQFLNGVHRFGTVNPGGLRSR
jgi:type II secretory pathway pseudopilin PulG